MKKIILFLLLIIVSSNIVYGNNLLVDIEIPEDFQIITSGKNLILESKIYYLDSGDRKDILVNVFIKDPKGIIIVSKSETLAIETQLSSIFNLNLPEDIKPGIYKVNVKVMHNGIVSSGSKSFRVIGESIFSRIYFYSIFDMSAFLVYIILFIIFGFLIFIMINQNRKLNKLIKQRERVDIDNVIDTR